MFSFTSRDQLQDPWFSHTTIILICKLLNFHQVSGFQNAEAHLDCLTINKLAVNLLHLNKVDRDRGTEREHSLLHDILAALYKHLPSQSSLQTCVRNPRSCCTSAGLALLCLGAEQVKGEKDEEHPFPPHPPNKVSTKLCFLKYRKKKKRNRLN